MTMGNAFWVLMLLWFVLGLWTSWPGIASGQWHPLAGNLFLFILLLLLGWHAFGPPIR